MKFDDFLNIRSKIEKLPLLGEVSQLKMVPAFRQEKLLKIKEQMKNARESAVLMLLYPDKNKKTKFVLILRKTYKGVHSNQVGFPGGQVEQQDTSLTKTALRETEEEIGIAASSIQILKELSSVYIPPSNFNVQPFIGFLTEIPNFITEEREVEEIIEVFLSDLLDDVNISEKKITTSYAKNTRVPAYKLNKKIVWGATAMILSEVKDLFKSVL